MNFLVSIMLVSATFAAPSSVGQAIATNTPAIDRLFIDSSGQLEYQVSTSKAIVLPHRDIPRLAEQTSTTPAGVPVVYEVNRNLAKHGTFTTPAEDLGQEYISVPGAVELEWAHMDGPVVYSIYRDRVLIKNTTSNRFIDRTSQPGRTYHYLIEADIDAGHELITDPVTKHQSVVRDTAGFSIDLVVSVPDTTGKELAAVQAAPGVQTEDFEYTTFIADAHVNAFPCVENINEYFNGNNRGFSSTATQYKTRVTLHADWTLSLVHATFAKFVEPTFLGPLSNPIKESKTADLSKVIITVTHKDTTSAAFKIDHSATNPFCPVIGGAIKYNVSVSLSRTGSYSMIGLRRPVPNHEAYVKKDGGAWHTVYQATNEGFRCLTGVCGERPIKVRGCASGAAVC